MFKKIVLCLFVVFLCVGCHRESLQQIHPTADEMKQLYGEGGTTVLGKKDAPITLVEVYAYDCRYCRQDYPLIEQFAKEHADVRVIFKPFLAFGSKTKVWPQYAALAAAKQGQFLAMHHALMTINRPLTLRIINKIAAELNLNKAKFRDDINSKEVAAQIEANTQLMDNLEIDGIPTLIMTQTRLISDPKLADHIPQYIQIGFLSNDILTNMLTKIRQVHA
jgi:hypothetical protein